MRLKLCMCIKNSHNLEDWRATHTLATLQFRTTDYKKVERCRWYQFWFVLFIFRTNFSKRIKTNDIVDNGFIGLNLLKFNYNESLVINFWCKICFICQTFSGFQTKIFLEGKFRSEYKYKYKQSFVKRPLTKSQKRPGRLAWIEMFSVYF